jgi:hypothetical protein
MSGAHTVFFDVAFMRRFGPERRRLAERIVGFVPKYNLVPTSGGGRAIRTCNDVGEDGDASI